MNRCKCFACLCEWGECLCALISHFHLTFSLALQRPTLSAFALLKDSRTKSALDLLRALPRAACSGLSLENQPQLSSKSCFSHQLKAHYFQGRVLPLHFWLSPTVWKRQKGAFNVVRKDLICRTLSQSLLSYPISQISLCTCFFPGFGGQGCPTDEPWREVWGCSVKGQTSIHIHGNYRFHLVSLPMAWGLELVDL